MHISFLHFMVLSAGRIVGREDKLFPSKLFDSTILLFPVSPVMTSVSSWLDLQQNLIELSQK
jgi:hypothetical protein